MCTSLVRKVNIMNRMDVVALQLVELLETASVCLFGVFSEIGRMGNGFLIYASCTVSSHRSKFSHHCALVYVRWIVPSWFFPYRQLITASLRMRL